MARHVSGGGGGGGQGFYMGEPMAETQPTIICYYCPFQRSIDSGFALNVSCRQYTL
jgi:hypothetical protein